MSETIKAGDAKFGDWCHWDYADARMRCVDVRVVRDLVRFTDSEGTICRVDSLDNMIRLPPECDSFAWQPSKEPDTGPCRKYLKRVILASESVVGHEYETAYGRVMAFRPRSNTGRDYINRDGIVLGFHRDSHFAELHDSPPIDDIPDESWDAMQEHVASTEELPPTSDQPPITMGSVWEIDGARYVVAFNADGFCTRLIESEVSNNAVHFVTNWVSQQSDITDVFGDEETRRRCPSKFIRQDPITSDIVDVGEGWELVPCGNQLTDGNEHLDVGSGKWTPIGYGRQDTNHNEPDQVCRRRIKPAHNLKVGDWVRLKDGSLDEVKSIHGEFIALQNDHSHAVKCVTKVKFRPFASAGEFTQYREKYGEWLNRGNKLSFRCRVHFYNDTSVLVTNNMAIKKYVSELTWEDALKYRFENGQPFGIAEDVK